MATPLFFTVAGRPSLPELEQLVVNFAIEDIGDEARDIDDI